MIVVFLSKSGSYDTLVTIPWLVSCIIMKKYEEKIKVALALDTGPLDLTTGFIHCRYFAICRPMNQAMKMTLKKLTALILFLWVISIIEVAPYYILKVSVSIQVFKSYSLYTLTLK